MADASPDNRVHEHGSSLQGGLESDLLAKHGVQGSPEGLHVCPPQDVSSDIGKPQRLNVLVGAHVVEHQVEGDEVDGEGQCHPPGHHDGEDAKPNGDGWNDDEGGG